MKNNFQFQCPQLVPKPKGKEHEKRLEGLFDENRKQHCRKYLAHTLKITAISHSVILKSSKHKL